MSKDKIKLVITHPCELSQRWVSYYCLDELCKNFDVEYWDCSAIVTAYTSGKMQYPIKRDYLVVIDSLKMFKSVMRQLPKDTILITEIHYNQYTLDIHRIQSTYFPTYAHINFYANTQMHLSERLKNGKFVSVRKKSKIKTALGAVRNRLTKNPLISDIDYILCHFTEKNFKEQFAIRKISKWYKFVWELSSANGSLHRINHPDYEQYLRDRENANPSRTIVFIDNYFPFHPEIAYCEPDIDVSHVAQEYYSSLNKFFDKLEKIYNCHVVIAAHPSSIFKTNPFGGRKLFMGETSSLIRDCQMVCMHTSNAFSYVVLYNKPVALITNTAYRRARFQMQRLAYCGDNFSIPVIDIDEELDLSRIFNEVNTGIRKKYISDYLADETLKANNAELITKYLIEFHDWLIDN